VNKIPATEKMVIAIRTKMMVIRVIREKIVAKVTTVVIVVAEITIKSRN
jgi:hypothetical protein